MSLKRRIYLEDAQTVADSIPAEQSSTPIVHVEALRGYQVPPLEGNVIDYARMCVVLPDGSELTVVPPFPTENDIWKAVAKDPTMQQFVGLPSFFKKLTNESDFE